MKETRLIMGMPVTVEILDASVRPADLEAAFSYFVAVDERFSSFKETSEVARINAGTVSEEDYSQEMRTVLELAEQTRQATDGHFNVMTPEGTLNPSGLVKGWAIQKAAELLRARGVRIFYVDAGGDVQAEGKVWSVGIRNPFKADEVVKALGLKDMGIATSGTYIRGQHIYNPARGREPITDIVSLTVLGPNVYEADRFATGAFAMGKAGIQFLEDRPGLEAYLIDAQGIATMTSGFEQYVVH